MRDLFSTAREDWIHMVLARKKKAQSNLHEGVVAHVNNVTEEAPVNVLDDRAGADFARVGVLGFANPFCSNLLFCLSFPVFSSILFYLVFWIDEGVIDSLGAVAEVEDGVDFLSTVEGLWGGNLTHALVG